LGGGAILGDSQFRSVFEKEHSINIVGGRVYKLSSDAKFCPIKQGSPKEEFEPLC